MSPFLKLLESRNERFIENISTESALGMVNTLWGIKQGRDERKNCVLISFDPPMGHPPIIFNWSESDVWYFRAPEVDRDFLAKVESLLAQSIHSRVIFLEKKSTPQLRMIQRFIRQYKNHVSLRCKAEEMPDFILAEYSGPLTPVVFTELKELSDDSLLA